MQRVVLRDVDLASLEASVGPASHARGTALACQRAVLQMVWVSSQHALCGVVRGSRGESATPAVYFSADNGLQVVRTQCSCATRTGCEHAVALVLAAASEDGEEAPARPVPPRRGPARLADPAETAAVVVARARELRLRTEQVLQQAEDRIRARELAALPEEDGTAFGVPDAGRDWSLEELLGTRAAAGTVAAARTPLGIELTLAAAQGDDAWPGLRVLARLVLPGKHGGWVRGSLSWNKLDSYSYYGGYAAEHVRLLREMSALYRFGGNEAYYCHPGDERTIDLSAFASSRLWPLLDEAEAAGIALVHGRGGHAVRRHGDTELNLDVTADGDMLLIAPAIGDDAVPVAFIGPAGHGVACVARPDADSGTQPAGWPFWIGRLATPAPRQLQRMALTGGRLRVPAGDLALLREHHYPRLRRLAPVISSDGSFEPPEISGPTLVLNAAYGEDHDLEVSWEWAYQVGDVTRRNSIDDADDDGHRDLAAERAILRGLPEIGQARRRLAGMDTMRFSTERLPLMRGQQGVRVDVSGEMPDYREAGDSLRIAVSAEAIAGENDWFDLGITVTIDGNEVPFGALFTALSRGEAYLLLGDGAYFSLEKPELRALARLIEEARALGEEEDEDGPLKISRFQAGLWEELAALGVVGRQARAWRRQVQGLLDMEQGTPDATPPPGTLRATLRPYQLDGFRWLAFLWENGLGGILADDMGLGKTLESLALISHARLRRPGDPPFLIVAPTSVVPNWAAEAARFSPGLTVVTVTDTLARRRSGLGELIAGADAVVTSYTLLRLDSDGYAASSWSGLILDEAQYIKNYRSKVYQCARRVRAPVKIAMSGTPMENNLMELWSLLSVAAPGLFPDPERFRNFYARPIERLGDTELLAQLRRRIRPLIKRRTKGQVAADLPAKQEQVLEVELHPRHRKLYQTYLQRERQKVLGLIGDMNAHRFTILRSLTLLRQLSLHAGLVDSEHGDLPCSKIDALIEQIGDVVAGGHRALVFSQFTSFLAIVRPRLEAAGLAYCYLDGATRDRAAVLASFKEGADPVFLISLKAGGFGLNLTEADYCFLLDPWWNPATEAQAIDRTHRIGQTRNVMVYRLIARDTIEEKVMALQARKAELFADVLDEGNAFGGSLDAEDIRGLFS